MNKPLSKTNLYIFTAVLAFCSMSYELLLAQLISAVLGNTILRYAITIGLFVFSLGIGSFIFEKLKNKSINQLIKVEVLLCILAILSPYLILVLRGLLLSNYQLFVWLAHIPIILVGILSGIELPLLMNIESNDQDQLKVLSVDYLGMFVASLAFPLILLPTLGVFSTLLLVCSFNFAVAILLTYKNLGEKNYWLIGFLSIGFVFSLTTSFLPEYTQQLASFLYRVP